MSDAGWVSLPSAPRYFANELGQIKGPSGRVLRTTLRRKYPAVTICFLGGEQKEFYVHVLVCEAFHGPKPSPLHEVAHRDGRRSNSRPDNLRWATSKENAADKIGHGTAPVGSKHPSALLTEDQVAEIKTVGFGMTAKALATRFGVTASVVHNIRSGRHWRHV